MNTVNTTSDVPHGIAPAQPGGFTRLDFNADTLRPMRQTQALVDLREGFALWPLFVALAWLDIKQRYRGSVLGPLWLTLSTAIMVAALGVLYARLFQMNIQDYLPFLSLSLVLWGFVSTLVAEGCTCFLSAEATIHSMRMPYSLYAGRVIVRNVLVLAHNVMVIVVVFVVFGIWPGTTGVLALPGLAVWLVDSLAVCLLLGAFCARFRDIPPIVASVMQIAFFISPIVWKPELLGPSVWWLDFNPFFTMLEIVRAPLLGFAPSAIVWLSALIYSGLLCVGAWLLFARVRGRLAFWV